MRLDHIFIGLILDSRRFEENLLCSIVTRGLAGRAVAGRALPATSRKAKSSHRMKPSRSHTGVVTPVPIPNTEVKHSRADGTMRATVWESRTLRDL